jgi:hypothetical protein
VISNIYPLMYIFPCSTPSARRSHIRIVFVMEIGSRPSLTLGSPLSMALLSEKNVPQLGQVQALRVTCDC